MSRRERNFPGPRALLVLATLLSAGPVFAQSTVGFADPRDTRALLDYRLPTWSYRIWSLSGGLNGGGNDYSTEERKSIRNQFSSALASDLIWRRMSDIQDRHLAARVSGDYRRQHDGNETHVRSDHELNGLVKAQGMIRRYLRPGGFYGGLMVEAHQSYQERIQEEAWPEDDEVPDQYSRRTHGLIQGDIGVGRLRDVTPIIRAQRLSERLVALGRSRLTRGQILRVADVLATEQGYRKVFDRPERNFWSDVLEPMLEGQDSLTPYEIFYLRDVMSESVGSRWEGAQTGFRAVYQGTDGDSPAGKLIIDERELSIFADWAHNLSLEHQLGAQVSGGYHWQVWNGDKREFGKISVRLFHFWCLADRYSLDTSVSLAGYYTERDEEVNRRNLQTRFDSEFRIYVEDSMTLVTGVMVGNAQLNEPADQGSGHGWDWSYRIGLEYTLDSLLY